MTGSDPGPAGGGSVRNFHGSLQSHLPFEALSWPRAFGDPRDPEIKADWGVTRSLAPLKSSGRRSARGEGRGQLLAALTGLPKDWGVGVGRNTGCGTRVTVMRLAWKDRRGNFVLTCHFALIHCLSAHIKALSRDSYPYFNLCAPLSRGKMRRTEVK